MKYIITIVCINFLFYYLEMINKHKIYSAILDMPKAVYLPVVIPIIMRRKIYLPSFNG